MKDLILKKKKTTAHFKKEARDKVKELGIDEAVNYYLKLRKYYISNPIYEKSWIGVSICDMSIEYLVNDL